MNAIHHLIDADQQQIICRPFKNRQIIPLRHRDKVRGLVLGAKPIDEVELGGHDDFI
jgi:hypothetical protein